MSTRRPCAQRPVPLILKRGRLEDLAAVYVTPVSPRARAGKEGFEMIRIEGEIVINRSPEEVFDFIADECNEARYNPRMRHAEQISDSPIGVGTRFRAESAGMGRPRRDDHRGHRL